MRRKSLLACLATGLLLVAPALAQHGHGNGMGGSMGGGMMGHGNLGGDNGAKGSSASQGGPKSASDLVAQNSQLSSRLQKLLPQGMTPEQACSGFKNLGQCVAAIHVSHNLGLNFVCTKADMTGQAPPSGSSCPSGTGSKSMSLGKTIQTLQPTADAKSETRKAEQQARNDLRSSGA